LRTDHGTVLNEWFFALKGSRKKCNKRRNFFKKLCGVGGNKIQISYNIKPNAGCCQVSETDDQCAAFEYADGICIQLAGREIGCTSGFWAANKVFDACSGRCLEQVEQTELRLSFEETGCDAICATFNRSSTKRNLLFSTIPPRNKISYTGSNIIYDSDYGGADKCQCD